MLTYPVFLLQTSRSALGDPRPWPLTWSAKRQRLWLAVVVPRLDVGYYLLFFIAFFWSNETKSMSELIMLHFIQDCMPQMILHFHDFPHYILIWVLRDRGIASFFIYSTFVHLS